MTLIYNITKAFKVFRKSIHELDCFFFRLELHGPSFDGARQILFYQDNSIDKGPLFFYSNNFTEKIIFTLSNIFFSYKNPDIIINS